MIRVSQTPMKPKKKRKKHRFHKPKPGRDFKARCPQKFGLGTVRIWLDSNPCRPDQVSAYCDVKFGFSCKPCGHTISMPLGNIMKGQGCGHCSNAGSTPLCGVLECDFCHVKSFAYTPIAFPQDVDFFEQKLREFRCMPCNPPPHTVKRNSTSHFTFNCENCPHEYTKGLGQITNLKNGCGYCNNKKRCGDPLCEFCTAHSVAGNEFMLKRWDIEAIERKRMMRWEVDAPYGCWIQSIRRIRKFANGLIVLSTKKLGRISPVSSSCWPPSSAVAFC